MTNKEEIETFTYKTTLVGDGSLYGWNKFNSKGEIVESSTQTWNSEADAEKAIRTIATGNDIVEVVSIKNINPDSNVNVSLVKKPEPDAVLPNPHGDERHAGMAVVDKSIEDAGHEPKEKAPKKSK